MSQRPQQFRTVVQRRGIALMLVMVAILVTGAMAVAYFGSRDNSIAISSNISSSSKARILAESGLDLAVAILETNSDWRTNHLDGVILQDHQICDGVATVTIIDSETGLPPTESTLKVAIKVASTFEGRTQYTEAIATIIPNEEEFDVDYSEFAVFARDKISLLGNSSIQNWSASPVSSEQSILIGTLSTNPMSVRNASMSNSSTLELRTPENASSMVSTFIMNSSEFTDSLPFLSPPSPPIEAQKLSFNNEHDDRDTLTRWAHRFTTNSSGHSEMRNESTIIYEGNYEIEELELTGNRPIEIRGDVTITVQDDTEMHNATIILSDDATLTMHFGGEVDITSSYIGNENQSIHSWMDPSRVRLYGHDDEDWNISGFSTLKSEIYAPTSCVELRGRSTVCGRIAGENVSLRGASRVLYDQSLNNGGFADIDSMLYNEDGSLQHEILRLTQLDPVLLDSIERAIAQEAIGDEYQLHGQIDFNWRSEPTDRPHTVIYMLVVYGVDARHWESKAREANRTNSNTHAGVDN